MKINLHYQHKKIRFYKKVYSIVFYIKYDFMIRILKISLLIYSIFNKREIFLESI